MPAHSSVRMILGVAAATFLAAMVSGGLGAEAESTAAANLLAQANNPKGKYLGADYCAQCHLNGPVANRNDDYVLLTEYKTWSTQDKHARAYKVLTEQRSKLIGSLMGIQDVTKDARCLNCHSANVPREQREEAEGQAYRIEDGVSCDSCHGPSSNWILPHSLPAWRTKPMSEKEALGMIDVRDPVKRSRLCFSCHIGSIQESKLLTHEMYAAGHPPLPSIEISTFSESMPQHWRYLREKKAKIQALLHYDPKELEQSKLTVIGGVVTLESSLELLARQVDAGDNKPAPDSGWPELSLFDCYACHHELRVPSWRQARGYRGKPGRPQPRAWPGALTKLGLLAAGQGKEMTSYQQLESHLHAAFDAQPFGQPSQIRQSVNALKAWCLQLEDRLNRAPDAFHEGNARRLLQRLCTQAESETVDYDSARQLAWAFRVIYREMSPKPANDADIQDKLKVLDQELKLSLPSGQQHQILTDLSSMLAKIADYDPERFKKSFAALSRLLPAD